MRARSMDHPSTWQDRHVPEDSVTWQWTWTELLARAKQRIRLYATISSGAGPYLSPSASKPGFGYYGVAGTRPRPGSGSTEARMPQRRTR